MEIIKQSEVKKELNFEKNLIAQQFPTVLQAIGNTPLIRLELNTKPTVLAKLEYANPGGSIKDRTALFMIEDAEARGLLQPGGTIVESSSGNQGIALAMIGAVKKYKVIITVPERTSKEKVATLKAYGAQVIRCPEDQGEQNAPTAVARRIAATTPGAYMIGQYHNPANARAHYQMTGPEIWKQCKGQMTYFVVGMGSCGVVTGAGRYFKEQNSNVKIIGVDAANSALSSIPAKPYFSEGLGVDHPQALFDKDLVDKVYPISDDDAFAMTRNVAQQYGLLVGISSGAVLQAVLDTAKDLHESDVIVCILADSGRAYLSKVFGLD